MTYEVYAHSGRVLMTTDDESCWYDTETALNILDAGYLIKLNGKPLTKAAIERRNASTQSGKRSPREKKK